MRGKRQACTTWATSWGDVMRIRPCIDIHDGQVKQIVGRTLSDNGAKVSENFISAHDGAYFADIYRQKRLPGGHIILLNSKKDEEMYRRDVKQALSALHAFPGGMQVGGGITPESAGKFLDEGASHVIVTSYVFRKGLLDEERLYAMERSVGRDRLVLDLSCRRMPDGSYRVVTDRWQTFTRFVVAKENLDYLSGHCDEFLIHAADVEGKRAGIEKPLVTLLGEWQKESGFPVTYAGGIHSLDDVEEIRGLSEGRMDVTVGSALDLFGGTLHLDDLIKTCE